MDILPIRIIQNKYTYPTLTNDKGMVGSVLKMKDAEFIVKACNEYPELKKRIEVLEAEIKKFQEKKTNE